MVRMLSSRTPSTQISSASEAPRWRQEARSRSRASATSRARRTRRISQTRSGSAATRSQDAASSARSLDAPAAAWPPWARPRISGATQVGACTPLVTEPIGTSAVSKPGHRPVNISRLTWPCSMLTPLTRWASRMPMTAMLKTSGSPPGNVSAPRPSTRSGGSVPVSAWPPNWRRTRSAGNRSMPAGTGVWVVKTVPARVSSSASSKPRPRSMYSRIRSTPRKPACPSLVWKTSGSAVPGGGAVGPHRPHPADAEQQFLAQPVLGAAAVQPVGHLAQGGLVLLHVGVQQQQRHAADLGDPDLGGQRRLGRQRRPSARRDPDPDRGAGRVPQQGQRQPVGVAGRVPLGLPALGRQRLGEVPVPVQQADADQRDAQVAGRLQVVAGQDAQPAGVLRQRRGDAVLGREVGDTAAGSPSPWAWYQRGPAR